jgi:hypothetical protein
MRIQIERRLSPVQRALLAVWKLLIGRVPGPMLVVSYRKRYFGNYWASCMQEGMRAARYWNRGEIELFAAFTSKVNSCTY